MAKKLFWSWQILLLAINVIPLGNDINSIIHKPILKFRLDYLLHFCSFLVFIPIYLRGIREGSPIFSQKPVLKYLLIVGGSAILCECSQFFLSYRTFNPIDLLTNFSGAILGTLVIALVVHYFKDKQINIEN